MNRVVSLAVAVVLGLLAGCAPRPAPQRFVVYFTENSAALDEPAQRIVQAAADWANQHSDRPVVVIGYAAPSPDSDVAAAAAAAAVSDRRARAVSDALAADGVPAAHIVASARGATDFTLARIESRRVEIDIGR